MSTTIDRTPDRPSLAEVVSSWVNVGWRVETQTESGATLVCGGTPNHVAHLIATLATCGLWGVGWLIATLASRERRVALFLDEGGTVQRGQISG